MLGVGLPLVVAAQDPDPFPNYVVIGAFAHHRNAIHFTNDANRHNFPAKFEMNPNRNLYYVYVLTTDDRQYAFSEALKLRTETKYFDTWVFSGVLGESVLAAPGAQQDFNPLTGRKMKAVNVGQGINSPANKTPDEPTGTLTSPDQGQPGTTGNVSAAQKDGKALTSASLSRAGTGVTSSLANTPKEERSGSPGEDEAVINAAANQEERTSAVNGPPNMSGPQEAAVERKEPPREFPRKASTAPLTPEEVAGKNFYFQLSRADNGAWVEGEIDAIDVERSRKMATYEANAPVKVQLPPGKSRQMSFVCQVFGYRKQQIEFDPASPSPELFLDDRGNLVVPFELVRLQKGDIAIMYNVFFFKDAAVMRPESRYEVNNLLELLNENPSYNIKIHGHTNGNATGKIIRMEKAENFYSLSNTKEGFGSAKKLSEERALVIRQFLISSGIPEARMQVKAWGGKKPIHDKHSVRAVENVRVEIEILSD